MVADRNPAPDSRWSWVELTRLGDQLSALRLRDPAAVERVRRSLSRHGQLMAVTVFDDGVGLQIADGFKRVQAAQALGWSGLHVHVIDGAGSTAAAALVTLHQRQELTELEEGWLVRWLIREHGLSQGGIAKLMGKHKSWVSRRLMLVDSLEPTVQSDVRLGLLTPRSALSVAALPRGNQQQAAELIMNHGMTTRQAEWLVRQLRDLDSEEARRQAMEAWRPSSDASDADPSRPRPRTESELFMQDVSTLMQVGVRLEVRLLDGVIARMDIDGAAHAKATLSELSGLLVALLGVVARATEVKNEADAATLEHP